MYPTVVRRAPNPRGAGVTASIRRRGARVQGMVSICELSINTVKTDQPKMLTGWSQKALWRVQGLEHLLSWAATPPVNRENLTPVVAHTEHGKPVCFLSLFGEGEESQAQARSMGMRVKDAGESECCSVIERIRVASHDNIIRHASAPTSRASFLTRKLD